MEDEPLLVSYNVTTGFSSYFLYHNTKESYTFRELETTVIT